MGTDRPQGTFDQVIDAAGKVLMPGLVNAHTHVPMTLMRGYGDGNNLQSWLTKFIFPVRTSGTPVPSIPPPLWVWPR